MKAIMSTKTPMNAGHKPAMTPDDFTPLLVSQDDAEHDRHELASPASEAGDEEEEANFSSALHRLYSTQFLSALNARTLEFGAVLILSLLYPSTLLPVSLYALVRATAAVFLSPVVGSLTDSPNRLLILRSGVAAQRLSASITCGLLLFLTFTKQYEVPLLAVLAFCAAVEKLASMLAAIAVERDWVVVLAKGHEERLRRANSGMRRIDLSCKLGAPLGIALVAALSLRAAIAVMGAIALVSLPVELVLIARVYGTTTDLHARETREAATEEEVSSPRRFILGSIASALRSTWADLRFYATHDAFLPSFSLSLLYLTVLSFGGQLIAYLGSAGFTSTSIGILRTLAAVCELSATFIAPRAIGRIGLIRTGIRALNFQFICIAAAAILLWLPDKESNSPYFLAAVILSRTALWTFDLASQQITQESVTEGGRGRFAAVEAGFQNAFELAAYAATVVFSRPEQFRYPVAVSAGSVGLATLLFSVYTRKRRGHLFHFSACVRCEKVHGRRAGGVWVAVPQEDQQEEN